MLTELNMKKALLSLVIFMIYEPAVLFGDSNQIMNQVAKAVPIYESFPDKRELDQVNLILDRYVDSHPEVDFTEGQDIQVYNEGSPVHFAASMEEWGLVSEEEEVEKNENDTTKQPVVIQVQAKKAKKKR